MKKKNMDKLSSIINQRERKKERKANNYLINVNCERKVEETVEGETKNDKIL